MRRQNGRDFVTRPCLTVVIAASALVLLIVPLAGANVPGVQITARPENPTNSSSATFQFSSSLDGDALFECQLDGSAFTPCLSPFTPPTLTDGTHTLVVRDAAAISDEDSFTWTVDTTSSPPRTVYLTPPGTVRRAAAKVGDRTVVLTWAKPADTDLASVQITRSVLGAPTSKVVYRGLRNTFKNSDLLNGVTYRFVLVGIDGAGNTSRPVVVSATPKPVSLASPKAGALIARPPLLRWVPDAPAGYFNVQLYRDGTKILSAWPNVVRLQIASHWSYAKHTYTLKPGVYTWYVWPGIGAREDVKYGELLGRSSFVVVAPKRL